MTRSFEEALEGARGNLTEDRVEKVPRKIRPALLEANVSYGESRKEVAYFERQKGPDKPRTAAGVEHIGRT